MLSSNHVYAIFLIATMCCFRPVSAQGNFSVTGSSYSCNSNVKCFGGAHAYTDSGKYAGRLSLISEIPGNARQSSGMAFYTTPVRMLDPSTRKVASFSTSFVVDQIVEDTDPNNSAFNTRGDGMTFLMSRTADQSTLGGAGRFLGFYDNYGMAQNRAVVVEFDSELNAETPIKDISDNHVSLDFMNITYVTAANASTVNVDLRANATFYVWIEYNAAVQQFEVRMDRTNSRPPTPLLKYSVDLFNVVDEYMWIGFSAGTSDNYSWYYIGEWTFESTGVPIPLQSSHKGDLGVILPIAIGVPVLVAVVALSILVLLLRRGFGLGKPADGEDEILTPPSNMPHSFGYKELSAATEAFSEAAKLGQGGFGSVYRGLLPTSGIPVAVKKVSGDSRQGEKEFLSEVLIISQLRHRNLIQLLGWCKDERKYLLVYELMPNGSLDKALFSEENSHPVLSWAQRFHILTGTAAALDYLHQGWKQQVIHRDLKPSNIMLDEEWNAKLGDFGLARLVDHRRQGATTTFVAGTYGYIAPEAAVSGRFTDRTDVFAFGAVLLEVACGRMAVASDRPSEERVLVDWVWRRLSEGDLLSVVDKRLSEYDRYQMEVVLLMGLLCSHPNPLARPCAKHVMQVLIGDAPVPSVPVTKPAPEFMVDGQCITIEDLQRSLSGSTSSRVLTSVFTASSSASDAAGAKH